MSELWHSVYRPAQVTLARPMTRSSCSREMSAFRQIACVAFLLGLLVCSAGGAPAPHLVLAPAPLPPQHRILDLRIAQVSISRRPMTEALRTLDHEISRQSGGKLMLPFEWRLGIRDPQVSIQAANVSLARVLNDLCRQSGLIYKRGAPGIAPPGLYFDEPLQKRR